jgi:hypothetical protein
MTNTPSRHPSTTTTTLHSTLQHTQTTTHHQTPPTPPCQTQRRLHPLQRQDDRHTTRPRQSPRCPVLRVPGPLRAPSNLPPNHRNRVHLGNSLRHVALPRAVPLRPGPEQSGHPGAVRDPADGADGEV